MSANSFYGFGGGCDLTECYVKPQPRSLRHAHTTRNLTQYKVKRQPSSPNLQYFYHPDHLGSSSFITNAIGYAEQHLQYLPYGETFIDQRNGYKSRYTFSAKEKDDETQYSYFGARYYDSDLSIWLSVDPLATEYPELSPYMYVAGNPLILKDPDGRTIVLVYEDGNGETQNFVFDGTNQRDAPMDPFVMSFCQAYNYNVKNGGGSSLQALATSTDRHIVQETDGNTVHNGGDRIYWNPHQGSLTSDGYVLSPATVLEEEATHRLDYFLPDYKEKRDADDLIFGNLEERRAKTHTNKTAIANGEVPKGYEPKGDGVQIGVFFSTSNKPTMASNKKFYDAIKGVTNNDWSEREIMTNEFIESLY